MKTNTKRITHYIMALVSIVVLVLLDQITKHLVVLHLKDRSAYVLIKDVFQLEYLENRGAAFGVLQNQTCLCSGICVHTDIVLFQIFIDHIVDGFVILHNQYMFFTHSL